MGLNLLEKSEVWINNLTLQNANLTQLAEVVADVLNVQHKNVLVVDVRPKHITLDILEENIPEENIVGKEKEILEAISKLEGVNVTEETYIHSNGILGMICFETENPKEMLDRISTMTDEIRHNIAKRAIVFPTGFEVRDKMIEDTNTPYLKNLLESKGFKVTVGDILEDNIADMENHISEAVSRAYGLIITTGGVGAEDKDKTVESILRVDPSAETPYIVKFKQGTGRHVKEGVRIAVGSIGPTYIVALPGPNDEVQLASKVLLQSLENGDSKFEMAQKLAAVLAEKLMKKKFHHEHAAKHEHGVKHEHEK
ncbi:competence/damage-inducible protein A [Clostridium bovifaecis]|uniref:Competence/damage-inducible protein A n=1 Tax=Clostridium bovifaecis TaxID=2184719 RepID=A0A6I6ERI8_9CLOT|nr:competence/damage-inducible protein A [Clostridium bovifaecis]